MARLGRKLRRHSRIAAEALPDLVRAPQGSVISALALARMRERVTMAAQEIAPRSIQLDNPAAADIPAPRARADEKGARPAESTRNVSNADGLFDILPVAAAEAHASLTALASARRLLPRLRVYPLETWRRWSPWGRASLWGTRTRRMSDALAAFIQGMQPLVNVAGAGAEALPPAEALRRAQAQRSPQPGLGALAQPPGRI